MTRSRRAWGCGVYLEVEAVVNSIYDPDETVIVTLQTGSGYTLAAEDEATVIIEDSPRKSRSRRSRIPPRARAPERSGSRRSGPTGQALTINYTVSGTAASGADFTALSGTATFAANSSTADVSISASNDSIAELAETVVVTLAQGTSYTAGSPWEATLTIADNETPVVNIEQEYDAFEGWTGQLGGRYSHRRHDSAVDGRTSRQAGRPRRPRTGPRSARPS